MLEGQEILLKNVFPNFLMTFFKRIRRAQPTPSAFLRGRMCSARQRSGRWRDFDG